MKRDQFLAQPEVESFVAWLVANLPTLRFKLRFKSSKFVPGGLQADVQGFEQVLGHYRWKASWQDANQSAVDSQTWADTQRSLGQLREWLTNAVNRGDEQQALQACLQILRWGGVRGAIPFLHRLVAEGELSSYLQKMAGLMSLDGDNDLEDLDALSVERFDSGLTKIHALLDASGSPIYDSRVGAAIGMLYSLFRQHWTGSRKPLLAFPSGGARGSQIRNSRAFLNGLVAPQFSQVSYEKWARWQVRLGWIIRAVLERTDWFAEQGALPARCHAFEASLFMLGYDLRCFDLPLAPDPQKAAAPVEDESEERSESVTGWVPTGHPFSQVLKDYLAFRKTGLPDEKASFVEWLMTLPRKGKTHPLYRAGVLLCVFDRGVRPVRSTAQRTRTYRHRRRGRAMRGPGDPDTGTLHPRRRAGRCLPGGCLDHRPCVSARADGESTYRHDHERGSCRYGERCKNTDGAGSQRGHALRPARCAVLADGPLRTVFQRLLARRLTRRPH